MKFHTQTWVLHPGQGTSDESEAGVFCDGDVDEEEVVNGAKGKKDGNDVFVCNQRMDTQEFCRSRPPSLVSTGVLLASMRSQDKRSRVEKAKELKKKRKGSGSMLHA